MIINNIKEHEKKYVIIIEKPINTELKALNIIV